jgi:hypothetical protein
MHALLPRFRWAIVLASLQSVVFAAVAVSEHRRNLRYSLNHDSPHLEYFGCLPLSHQGLSPEERTKLAPTLGCAPDPRVKLVTLLNFPVFLVWAGFAELSSGKNLDQFWLFNLFDGFGILLFWFFIGSLIGRRRNPAAR